MKKKILYIVFIILFFVIAFNTNVYADDLDEIEDFEIIVDPRMNDGTLDITYKVTWKVLDSTTEGPLEWVEIGTANEYFNNITKLSSNIDSISKSNGSYVKIVFNRKYYAGDVVTFKYKIHQRNMYTISFGKCNFNFTPAWFSNAKVDKITVKWNKDSVKSSNSDIIEDNYYVWTKNNLAKGEKIQVKVKYDKNDFSSIVAKNNKSNSEETEIDFYIKMIIIIFVLTFVITIFSSLCGRRILWTQRILRRLLWGILWWMCSS